MKGFEKVFEKIENDAKEILKEFDLSSIKKIQNTYAIAKNYYDNGKYTEAEEIFKILIVKDPHLKIFWYGLASCQQAKKKYTQALSSWAILSLLDEKNPFSHFYAAECYFSLKDSSNAFLALDEVEKRIDKKHPLFEKVNYFKVLWK